MDDRSFDSMQHTLDTCVDADAMRVLLQPLLAPGGSVDAVRVVKARRSASKRRHPNPLLVLYDVDVRDAPDQPLRTVGWHGKVYRDGAATALREAGPLAVHVASLDLLLWPWPHDPALPQLPRLLAADATCALWGQPAAAVEVVRYEPGRRATLRYKHDDGRSLYAKTFDDDRGHAIYRRFAWFWERAQRDAAAPAVAEPLAYDANERTLWQASATGEPLRSTLDKPVPADTLQGVRACTASDWPWRLARALAVVHDAPTSLAGERRRDTAHWLTEVGRRRKKIARAVPEVAALAEATATAIEAAAETLVPYEPSLIHGDVHVDQIWLDGERVVLFDFDEFALGDPMEDLAELVVKLPATEPTFTQGATRLDAGTRIVAAYAQHAPHRFGSARFAWHLAVQQLLQASRAFVFQVSDWRGEVGRRLERAHALATGMELRR